MRAAPRSTLEKQFASSLTIYRTMRLHDPMQCVCSFHRHCEPPTGIVGRILGYKGNQMSKSIEVVTVPGSVSELGARLVGRAVGKRRVALAASPAVCTNRRCEPQGKAGGSRRGVRDCGQARDPRTPRDGSPARSSRPRHSSRNHRTPHRRPSSPKCSTGMIRPRPRPVVARPLKSAEGRRWHSPSWRSSAAWTRAQSKRRPRCTA